MIMKILKLVKNFYWLIYENLEDKNYEELGFSVRILWF